VYKIFYFFPVLSLITGCSLGYLAKQGTGHLRLMSQRVSLEKAFEDGSLSPQQADKVRLIQEVKHFAEEKLGLKKTDNYRDLVAVPDGAISYTVTAAFKDRLEPYTWRFPFVGRVSYKGFFSRQDAENEREELEQKDYDTSLQGVTAYSTLGWFDDPIFSSLLAYDDLQIVNTVIHELVHATFYVKGETGFNESTAVYVAAQGTLEFARWKFGENSAQAQMAGARLQDEVAFSDFLSSLWEKLLAIYDRSVTREEKLKLRERVFAQCRSDYENLIPSLHSGLFRQAFSGPINNAVLISYFEYHLHMRTYQKIQDRLGGTLNSLLALFRQAADSDNPWLFLGLQRPPK